MNGILEHNLNQTLLQAIAAKHTRIGTVPKGYYYAELYQKFEKHDWRESTVPLHLLIDIHFIHPLDVY